MHFVLSVMVAALAGLVANASNINAESIYNYYRLPDSIQPERYQLKIITNFDDFTFNGEVSIRFKALADTNNITLHSQNLTIDVGRIQLKTYSDNHLFYCSQSVETVEEHDYLIIHLCRNLIKDDMYKVKLYFKGVLNEKLHGYYRSSYIDKASNKSRFLSVTQFEPAFARGAFPCLDEPNYKAKFVIWLGHHRSYNALSNMPLEKQEPISDMKDYVWSIFEESVPMSTYLIAYTINDFTYKSSGDWGTIFRTWSRPDAMDQCEYASEVGPKVLKFYEKSFGIPFPLKKIDQIAVPDFSAGAMENWGLVTYRETALLFAPNISSENSKLRIVSVISHELAHQWFGNLVTMKWWSDLWLNEGFATYIASLGVHHLNPDWDSLNEESLDNLLVVFRRDAQLSSHPISQPIQGTHQIGERFDSISYKKGSAVLRMLHLMLGEEAFFESIHNYLENHMFGNAEQDDLWASFTERARLYKRLPNDFDMKTIMDSWTLQTGFPLVKVVRNYNTGATVISQLRFLENGTVTHTQPDQCWWVPLSFTNSHEMDFNKVLPQQWLKCDENKKSISLTLENVANSDDWLLFNIQLSGVYRVMYDEENWLMLNRTLNSDAFNRIHVLNRAQLIDDALSLAWSGYQDYDIPLHMLEYMVKEREYLPWRSALDSLSNVNRLLRNFHPTYKSFTAFMRYIITPTYYYLDGLNQTDKSLTHSKVLHKSLIASWACRLELEDCVKTATKYFAEWRATPYPHTINLIPVDLRPTVYCTAIRHGSQDDWTFLWKRYQESNVASEKSVIIFSLSCSENATILRSYIDMIYDKQQEQIRHQDSAYAFGSIARNQIGFKLAKDYYVDHIDDLYNFYGPLSHELGSLLAPLSSQIINIEDLNQLMNLINSRQVYFKKAEKSVLNALETININLEWINNNLGIMRSHLEARTSFTKA